MAIEVIETEQRGTIIKVVGVGGAGGNAINHMIRTGVRGVEFIVANTDAQALSANAADTKIQLGSTGLGAGNKPDVARSFADEARDQIRDALEGAHMVFITAGMGKGTGTGAAPIIAQVAKELGALTVGVVTKPFSYEGPNKMDVAVNGADDLAQHVDSLIVILNEKLEEVYPDATMKQWYGFADEVLNKAVAGIAEIINVPGHQNVDFNDVRTIMSDNRGKAMMGTATARGATRAKDAAEAAVASPLLEGIDLSGARGVLVNITAHEDTLKGAEVKEILNTVRNFCAPDALVVHGVAYEEGMGEDLRVTVVVTGLGRKKIQLVPPVQQPALRTGTYDAAPAMNLSAPASTAQMQAPQTPMTAAPVVAPAQAAPVTVPDFGNYDTPAVWRNGRSEAQAKVNAMQESGMDRFDIPAFLRKQAD
ncbi:MAG TPA: cell division protein FtsZ [Burkholderiaceae bacterium]|nr:cell division protein FtsZ [Burkholderiaceae bacterium]